eukprot:CAMPEP_0117686644 /NCGR_PEP_ID=MMETSP0804-20121206/22598_1 /TAXON_ID=1074897 /ORGANISM="Tetraselmis astigmatica, Strain CCMP880" /LENGTH=78 /DNA_ID=CAMNT_0005498427 /DNA_START=419 /DNA_END=652 /DNA_ORIENTATION=+
MQPQPLTPMQPESLRCVKVGFLHSNPPTCDLSTVSTSTEPIDGCLLTALDSSATCAQMGAGVTIQDPPSECLGSLLHM